MMPYTFVKYKLSLILFVGLFLLYTTEIGAEDTISYANQQLENEVQEREAFALMEVLRCIQCQGQSIADSDAPIAEAMRHQVRVKVMAGEDSAAIKDWMIVRYGDYVSYEPPLSGVSLLLWGIPVFVFILALLIVIPIFRSKKTIADKGDI